MRIGIASLEHVHAETYVRLLHDWDGAEVLVADPGGEHGEDGRRRTRERLASLGVPILGTFDELLAELPDGVVVCTPNAQHRQLVVACARAGVPVLCEKPIATSLEDAPAMVSACDAAGVGLMLAYPTRFSPGMREQKRVVDDGAIGRLLACDGSNVARIPTRDRSWFGRKESAGGGALMDHTVHLADILLYLLDSPAVEVYAQTNAITHRDRVEEGVETGAIVSITFATGVTATIDASWSLPDAYPTWGGLDLRLIGSEGELSIDLFGEAVTGYSQDPPRAVWRSHGVDINRLMLGEFLSSIEEGRAPSPDGHDGISTLRIVLAAYESASLGRPVELPAPLATR